MQELEDLTAKLVGMDEKDTWYQVDVTFGRLLAEQSNSRPIEIKEEGWGEETKEEEYQTGTPETMKAPTKRKGRRAGTGRSAIKKCWTFLTRKKAKDETVLIHFGGEFGVIHQSFIRSLDAQKKVKYDAPPLELIGLYPEFAEAGPAPPDSITNGGPQKVMVPRPARGGMTSSRVDEYFDFVEDRTVRGYLKVDATCPLNEEKVLELLKSLKTLKSVGPAKRGSIKSIIPKRVKLTADEIAAIVGAKTGSVRPYVPAKAT